MTDVRASFSAAFVLAGKGTQSSISAPVTAMGTDGLHMIR